MIHEVMVLDHSGPDLALVHYAGALKLTVSGEVFNVLNNNTMLDTYQRWGNYNANTNTFSGPRSDYGTPYTIEQPRQVRLGVRLEF